MTIETADFYHKNNYLFIKNIVDRSYCDYLVSCVNDNILKKEYCINHTYRKGDPNSYSYYTLAGTPYFNKLLLEFQENFESLVNKKLYPTYSCSKMYAKNDVLVCHSDRHSCEYSVTITLGFSHEPWEFCISKDGTQENYTSFEMEVGDAVLYNGFIPHWRKDFLKGDWHSQVFLHYVDANGPYAHLKYNGNESLNL